MHPNKPKTRKMWMFPRCIRRITPWKLVQELKLLTANTSDLRDQVAQNALYRCLESVIGKVPTNKDGTAKPGGMRTYLAQLECLGFLWWDGSEYRLTYAGEQMADGDKPLQVLRCQLMRMQYPSVYGAGRNVRCDPVLKVRPLAFIVKLLQDKRLGGWITDSDIALAVVHGRSLADYERCVTLIKTLRADPTDNLLELISVDDVRTPKRYCENDPDYDLQMGIEDARNIANTARNYLQAALIILPDEEDKKRYRLTDDEAVLEELKKWIGDGKPEAFDPSAAAAWQQRYGRFTKEKSIQRTEKRKRNSGLEAMLQSRYIAAVADEAYAFSHAVFVKAESARWGIDIAEAARIVDPLKDRVSTIVRDTVMTAATSGGKEAIVLEKSVASIFKHLGFDETEHLGQRKAPREGGYPDVWIKASSMTACGMGDSKATMNYGFPIGDTQKLGSYYKECWKELDENAPSEFFLYVAGGFARSSETVVDTLKSCSKKYGRPVSAVTASALVDLVEMERAPAPDALFRAFKKGRYFTSSELIVEEAK